MTDESQKWSMGNVHPNSPTRNQLMSSKSIVNVVLVTPEIPQNTGNVIRLCANVGARLHLVKPLGFRLDNSGLRRAALDYRDIADIVVHSSIEAFLESLPLYKIYGAITDGLTPYDSPRYLPGDAILFGPESSGLPHELVSRLPSENRVRIPMKPSNRSLNLSNAVAIIVYEMWRQMDFRGTSHEALPNQSYFS